MSSTSPKHGTGTLAGFTSCGPRLHWSDTYHAPGSADRLRVLDDRYGLTGFAHYTADKNDGWLVSDEADAVFSLAAERGLLISLGASPAWQADLRTIARRHSSVPVLCQTLGGVPAADGVNSPALYELLASAEVPNIFVKVAGFHYYIRPRVGLSVARCGGGYSRGSRKPSGRIGSVGDRTFPPRLDSRRSGNHSRL